MLGGFGGMMRGVGVMSLREVRMMSRRFVIAVLVMLGSFAMMIGRLVMMIGSLSVMVRRFLRHGVFLSLEKFRTEREPAEHCAVH